MRKPSRDREEAVQEHHIPIQRTSPCDPPCEPEKPYDFDIDAVIFSFYNTKVLQDHEKLLDQALKKFPGKPLMGSLYLNAGSDGRWLCSQAAGPGPVTNGPCVLT